MVIEQIYTGCLAQGAYYIHSKGEGAIIDPLREVQPYIDKAKEDGVKIKYVFETHFHADFVSGHISLAERTGAPIIYGPNADPTFDATIAKDQELFQLGDLTIKVLHTPGHTMESTSYLLLDAEGNEHALFTGDTLFLGDVGRPDLAQKGADMTMEDLAGHSYDSLRTKIMPLPDEVMVYPAHGAGSACGKKMMKITKDTLGNQKKVNYALRADMTKAEFIKEVTDGLEAPPAYFPLNVKMNREGYDDIAEVIKFGTKALTPDEFEKIANETEAIMLDVRSKLEYTAEHIPNSIFIGLDGSFAPWVGELIKDVKQAIILIVPEGREEEAVTRLSRVGFDNTLGYLEGGMAAWKNAGKESDCVQSISAVQMEDSKKNGSKIYDLRKPAEYQAEHGADIINTPLSQINNHLDAFPAEEDFFIHCASGYRSIIGASILKSRGIHNVINVDGGFKAMKKSTKIPTVENVCSSTL